MSVASLRPLRPLASLLLVAIAPLPAADPPAMPASVRAVNLQMERSATQDTAELHLELVTSFKDGRLISWQDARIERVEAEDGTRLISNQQPDAVPNLGGGNAGSEDDLAIPLSVQFSGFERPPMKLKTLRVDATAVIALGGIRELSLPKDAADRTFAPQDDKKATVVVARENNQWRLTLTNALARRTLRVLLRQEDGTPADCWPSIGEHGPARTVIQVSGNNEQTGDAHLVLVLAERVEERRVRLSGDNLVLFGASGDPELLPLGTDPGSVKSDAMPIESGPP